MVNKIAGFFITATDTEIGKTWISRMVIDSLSELGVTCTYMKPVQTGCIPDSTGQLNSPDLEYIMQGKVIITADYNSHVPYRFEKACSPHLAAQQTGTSIRIDHILKCLQGVAQNIDCVIIEGAGGIYVPLNRDLFILNLIRMVQMPVIVVTSPRLGTLNHTLLTIHALHANNCSIAGVVYNNIKENTKDAIYIDNKDFIAKAIAPIPFLELDQGQILTPATKNFCHALKSRYL